MEDIVHVVDGRVELLKEVQRSPDKVRDYLQEEFETLITDEDFIDKLPGHFNPDATSQARVPLVIERLRKLAGY